MKIKNTIIVYLYMYATILTSHGEFPHNTI
jgi:hypothetical protein